LPDSDIALLVDAARAAGEIARRHWRRDARTWGKAGGAGPVTEADLEVDAMLRDRLTSARPDYGWLSEETPDDPARLGAGNVFIVDPIDGTRAFIAGDRTFAHSLAVARDGAVQAAAVFLPMHDLLFTAITTGPALLNGAPIRASARAGAAGATLLTARANLAAEHWPGGMPDVRREFRASLAYRLCLVAEGRFDAMLSLGRIWEWDIAAGDLIARRAGATVADRHGRAIRYNAPDPRAAGILAAPPALFADLSARLAPKAAV